MSEHFVGVAVKTLTRVDATARSNQHEIGTTVAMRRFLGEEKREFPAIFLWLGREQESFSEDGKLSLYDSREKKEHRGPEWRLYYPTNAVTEAMTEGETLFLALRTDGSVLFIVSPAQSTIQSQLLWLFGFDAEPELAFDAHQISGDEDAELDFAARLILDEIGVEYEDPEANTIDAIIEKFGTSFPSTREFSDLARLTLPSVDARDDADAALLAWLSHEEGMFRRLERKAVSERLSAGFRAGQDVDVDGFVQFSLGVHNRRKSRMGYSFEHHLEAVFRAFGLAYGRQVKTEHGNTADFLFPGAAAYHDPGYPGDRLTMLAAKSTCKDRWRQVLPEAHRIWPKHLATLEPAISVTQTEQMKVEGIQLVIPQSLQETYRAAGQRGGLMSLAEFVAVVRQRADS
ncbi:MAG: type II restriction endonuclease [Candidatus Andeanibacterium colombiense]|uniref:Type II restriction endonuclease n=1 Tax=Candidatus Andeanibacterium colombiense TaxID=3121345 RepID=A0AAJ5X590_9SPHN|nr:MAG: type II restriction endonuclease [Sphingomonadaceae bacterium]